jgi:hypothetical protein
LYERGDGNVVLYDDPVVIIIAPGVGEVRQLLLVCILQVLSVVVTPLDGPTHQDPIAPTAFRPIIDIPRESARDTDSDRTSSCGGSGSTIDDRSRISRGSKKKKTRRTATNLPPSLPGAARPASPSPSCGGGDGSSRFSFLSHVLDVYILNGLGCCRHTDGEGDGDVRPMSGGICA